MQTLLDSILWRIFVIKDNNVIVCYQITSNSARTIYIYVCIIYMYMITAHVDDDEL